MNTIGPVLDISTAIISTNDNYTDEHVIFEFLNGDELSYLVMQVWEKNSGPCVDQFLKGAPVTLRDGVCHTFQWRLEEDDELIEHDEALDPRELIHNFPDELIDDANRALNSWLASDYAAMNPEVQ